MAMVTEASPSRRSDGIPRRLDAGPGLECCSFSSSASFIDMDPADLFSMRWTTSSAAEDEAAGFGFGLPCSAAQYQYCSSPLLVGSGGIPLLPPSVSSPASFYSARSTPAAAASRSRARRPLLLATRRVLQRYLRLLAPLCRKARALAASSSPRTASASASPGRQSTSSYASAVEQYWCHGNADSAVRDAILYCKRSVREQDV